MANELQTIDSATGEVMSFTESVQPLALQLAQAELNQAVTTAKAFPRSVAQAVRNIMELATLDEESAAECVYALPRGGKPIKGPSVRFAEIVASQWGNCHTASRIVAIDRFEKVVIAEGVFFDLETGAKRKAEIRRRISDKSGRLFNDDMIAVTGNAAASIAMREAILKGIPKAVWRKAYERCEGVIAGDVRTLSVRREEAIKAFAVWGIKPEQIFSALEIGGLDDLGLDELGTLVAMHKAIKAGEQKVEDYFPAKVDPNQAVDAAKGTAAKLGKIAESAKSDAASEGPETSMEAPPRANPAENADGSVPKDKNPEAPEESDAAGRAAEGKGDRVQPSAANDFPGDKATPSSKPDFDALLAEFERDAPNATTEEELGDLAADLRNAMDAHTPSQAFQKRAATAWQGHIDRIKGVARQSKAAPAASTDDPDFQKGWADAKRNATKCLKQDIRDNPDRLAKWQAGFDAFKAQGAEG